MVVGLVVRSRIVRELSMATKRELTKVYAREYQRASKKTKGVMLDEFRQ